MSSASTITEHKAKTVRSAATTILLLQTTTTTTTTTTAGHYYPGVVAWSLFATIGNATVDFNIISGFRK